MNKEPITLYPIGVVRNVSGLAPQMSVPICPHSSLGESAGLKQSLDQSAPEERHAKDAISDVVVFDDYLHALEGIEAFSHIIVLFWMHLLKPDERSKLKVHPRHNQELPLTGVFATRSPVRPNPVGISIVPLLKKQGGTLTVKGLGALEGSPVVDIKPYLPEGDSYPEAAVASWVSGYAGTRRV